MNFLRIMWRFLDRWNTVGTGGKSNSFVSFLTSEKWDSYCTHPECKTAQCGP